MSDIACAYCPAPATYPHWGRAVPPMCEKHYRRWLRHGDPNEVLTPGVKPTTPEVRRRARLIVLAERRKRRQAA